jgi:glycosyltransferase involved in cell wall biosynthesis
MRSPVLCFCNSNRAWGGGEKWHLEAALSMAERGVHVLVAAREGSPLLERARRCPQVTAVAVRYTSLGFLNPFAIRSLAAMLRRHGVSHLILGLPRDVKVVGLAAKCAGISSVFYRRGTALPVRNSVFNRVLYGMLTGLIVNSQATRRMVLVNNPELMPQERIHLLPNGIDTENFDAELAAASPDFRRAADPSPFWLVGAVGRLTKQKGQKYLLHMAASLARKAFPFRLILAGEGVLEAELKTLAKELGVTEHVVFAGFQPKLGAFWQSVDMLVHSSLWEGFGYVVAEAMLAEKPVLAFDVSNMPELVASGRNGALLSFPVASESDAAVGNRLAAAVAALAADPGYCRALGREGRKMCIECYSQKIAMDGLHNVLWPEKTLQHVAADARN